MDEVVQDLLFTFYRWGHLQNKIFTFENNCLPIAVIKKKAHVPSRHITL